MNPILFIIGELGEDGCREGEGREIYLEVPIDELHLVKPVELTLYPVRVRKGEMPKPRSRKVRKIGFNWIDVLGPFSHRKGEKFVAELCTCEMCRGARLFVHLVNEPTYKKGARFSRFHIRLPEVP